MRRAAIIALLSAYPSLAGAQVVEPRGFSAERFALSFDRSGLLNVEWADIPSAPMAFDVSLWFGVADDPLTFQRRAPDGTTRVGSLVGTRVGGGLALALAFDDRVQLGLEVPLVFYQSRQRDVAGLAGPLEDLTAGGVGTPRLAAKLHLVHQRDLGVHVTLMPAFTIPAGQRGAYLGQDGLVFEPALLVARTQGRARVGLNAGVRVRQEVTYLDLEVDDEIFAGLGAGYRLEGAPVELDATLAFAVSAEAPFERSNQGYLELMGGASLELGGPVLAFAGAGIGLNDGFGSPDWRVLGGLRLTGGDTDRDGDGRPDDDDLCPDEPEDLDGVDDLDGCPDGDEAPAADPDADDDGVFDWDDACPKTPGPRAAGGCPEKDQDGDGIADHADLCPTDAEDADQFEDDDGCPDPDDDGDGTLDAQDQCPRSSGPSTNEGCPEPKKPIATAPATPEPATPEPATPERAKPEAPKVRVGADKLEINGTVYFDTGSARIQPRSFPLLDEVAQVIVAHPELRRISVEGHTDSQGADTTNLTLSDRRAASVKAYLVERGVDAARLSSVGYGETRPVADNATREGRAANRRVEFVIDPNP